MSDNKTPTPAEDIPPVTPRRPRAFGLEPGALHGSRTDYTPAPVEEPFADVIRAKKELNGKEWLIWIKKNRSRFEEYERSKQ